MAGSLKQNQYNLENVVITLNTGVVADVTALTISRKTVKADRKAGQAKRSQRTINHEDTPTLTIEGYNSANISFGDLEPGAKITALTVMPTSPDNVSFLGGGFMGIFPLPWYLGDTDTSLGGNDNSKWRTGIDCDIVGSNLASSSVAVPTPGVAT